MEVAKVGLPVMLYNNPGRTAVAIEPATVARLAEHPWIRSVKHASGDFVAAGRILAAVGCSDSESPSPAGGFSVLSGGDAVSAPLAAMGGKGIVGVLGNLAPREVKVL